MTVYAYSFMSLDARRPDGVIVDPDAVEVYPAERPLKICRHGFHASTDILDALFYGRWKGPLLRRVCCSGEIVHQNDKFVCRSRVEVWRFDCTRVLQEWACWCARRALERERATGREPDVRLWRAIEAAEAYLRGIASLKEVCDAARSAAGSAAWSAADAAVSAAWSAAWSARSAAGSARSAARSAADAARSAAWSAAESAAWSAESAAARKKEREAQRKELLRRIDKARKALQ